MALSNIFREPRRELTEQALGIATVLAFSAALIAGLAFVAILLCYFLEGTIHLKYGEDWIPYGLGSVIVTGFVALTANFFHEVGEETCGWLAEHGFDPRPKNRR